jgi:hypothetical protein
LVWLARQAGLSRTRCPTPAGVRVQHVLQVDANVGQGTCCIANERPVEDLEGPEAHSARIEPMADDARALEQRKRAARSRWPIARFRLGEEPSDDLSEVTTPAERIAMMWELAESAWKLAGRPWPTYERRNIPARLFRPGTPPPADDDA